jgi:LytS/YehU family sensor histidine kinase
MENIQKRLDLLYPNQYELNISDDNGEFGVELELQLN